MTCTVLIHILSSNTETQTETLSIYYNDDPRNPTAFNYRTPLQSKGKQNEHGPQAIYDMDLV